MVEDAQKWRSSLVERPSLKCVLFGRRHPTAGPGEHSLFASKRVCAWHFSPVHSDHITASAACWLGTKQGIDHSPI